MISGKRQRGLLRSMGEDGSCCTTTPKTSMLLCWFLHILIFLIYSFALFVGVYFILTVLKYEDPVDSLNVFITSDMQQVCLFFLLHSLFSSSFPTLLLHLFS